VTIENQNVTWISALTIRQTRHNLEKCCYLLISNSVSANIFEEVDLKAFEKGKLRRSIYIG